MLSISVPESPNILDSLDETEEVSGLTALLPKKLEFHSTGDVLNKGTLFFT